MKIENVRGLTLAAAAGALFTSGATFAAEPIGTTEAKIHCGGVNSCKGTSNCKTAQNACKGQNSCKGRGLKSHDRG